MKQSSSNKQESPTKQTTQCAPIDETPQLSQDNQVNDRIPAEEPKGQRWRLLIVLLLSILISHAPTIYARFALVEGGVSKNDFMFCVALPLLSQMLMVTAVLALRRAMKRFPTFIIPWLKGKKRSDIIGTIALFITIIMVNAILRYVLKRLNITTKNFMFVSTTTTPGITLLTMQTLRILLVTPFVEEVFWRVYAQDILQRTFKRPLGLFAQAALFASVHMRGLAGRLPVFFLGLILGIWRDQKKSLVPLIVAHMAVNALWCARFWNDHMELRMVRITHDYRVPLENLCRPADYAPEKNALPNYTRASELLIERPNELEEADLKAWPTDLSDEKIILLRNWISSNQHAIREFEAGSQKPYYFREYSKEPFWKLFSPLNDESAVVIIALMLSRAQISAAQGDPQSSVSDILTCYRFGQHFAAPKPLVEQLLGLGVKEQALHVAFLILNRSQPTETYLTELQIGLEAISEREKVPIDFTVDRLIFHELIQRTFTDNGTGNGRIPRAFFDSRGKPGPRLWFLGRFQAGEEQIKHLWYLERRQTVRFTDVLFSRLSLLNNFRPAKLHSTGLYGIGKDVKEIIRQSVENNAFLLALTKSFENDYHYAYWCEACKDALIVTAAIMRYQLAQGELPDELDQLVRAGYLDNLPLDPYSDASFVYRKMDSDFLLYSLGRDFDDDGGIQSSRSDDIIEGDDVFWPFGDN